MGRPLPDLKLFTNGCGGVADFTSFVSHISNENPLGICVGMKNPQGGKKDDQYQGSSEENAGELHE
jgi:hypothetical protein